MYPGPKSRYLTEQIKQLSVMDTRPFAINLAKSKGMYLRTLEGFDIFDWAGFYGSRLLSYNHSCYNEWGYKRKLVRAANNKIANPDFVTQELTDYYNFLADIVPECLKYSNFRIYTLNSGAEAVENAFKYCVNNYFTKNNSLLTHLDAPKFICFEGAFHGRTVYALSHTDTPYDTVSTKDFRGLVLGPIRLPFPTPETWEESFKKIKDLIIDDPKIAGIIIEPLQSAGGNRIVPTEWLRSVSDLLYKEGRHLIIDEVQTGGGPTGTMWMIDQYNLPYPPDCIVSAKKLGCGVLYMKEAPAEEVLDSTWSGSLVDMVRIPQEFKAVKKEKLIEKVKEKQRIFEYYLNSLLKEYPKLIKELNGTGLYLGIKVRDTQTKTKIIQDSLYRKNLLLLGAGQDVIRFRPNLNVTNEDFEELYYRLSAVLARLDLE